jgi:hypothetical protein
MNISQKDWDQWKENPVTKEWLKLFRERQNRYENLIPALIATGTDEAVNQSRVASGRHQELDDLLKTNYEDMK